jgi:hypothetical protein
LKWRQLFEAGVLQSGFWHQFAMTAHSPVGMHPEKFGVVKETEIMELLLITTSTILIRQN